MLFGTWDGRARKSRAGFSLSGVMKKVLERATPSAPQGVIISWQELQWPIFPEKTRGFLRQHGVGGLTSPVGFAAGKVPCFWRLTGSGDWGDTTYWWLRAEKQ